MLISDVILLLRMEALEATIDDLRRQVGTVQYTVFLAFLDTANV